MAVRILSSAENDIPLQGERSGTQLRRDIGGGLVGMDPGSGKIPAEPGFEIRSFSRGQGLSASADRLQSRGQIKVGSRGLARPGLGVDGFLLLGAFGAQTRSAGAFRAQSLHGLRSLRRPGRDSAPKAYA